MADRRRTSETQMADLNMQLDSQTEQIKNMRKVAQENNNITNDIQGQLYRQRGVIEENISKVTIYLRSRTNKQLIKSKLLIKKQLK